MYMYRNVYMIMLITMLNSAVSYIRTSDHFKVAHIQEHAPLRQLLDSILQNKVSVFISIFKIG
jgi:4-hydroxy-L-threonine phosphate dehydrogenase PdxA